MDNDYDEFKTLCKLLDICKNLVITIAVLAMVIFGLLLKVLLF